jgi:LysM repeat protein
MNIRFPQGLRFCCWPLLLGLLAPLFLTQCKSTGGTYKDVEYDPATLKTPGGHGLEKKEYPFDDEGNYRKDWVRNKTSGRTRSSYRDVTPTASAPETTEVVQSGPTNYPNYQDISSGSGSTPSTPAPPSPASPQYHKVVSGDTLYSLANRYGTTVPDLKRTNGLTGDSIRKGQTLRIP